MTNPFRLEILMRIEYYFDENGDKPPRKKIKNRLPVVATKTERCFTCENPAPRSNPERTWRHISYAFCTAFSFRVPIFVCGIFGIWTGNGVLGCKKSKKQRSVFVATTGNRFLIFLRGGLSPFSSKWFFWENFSGRLFLEEFFWRNFSGRTFLEEFLEEFFWKNFSGRIPHLISSWLKTSV